MRELDSSRPSVQQKADRRRGPPFYGKRVVRVRGRLRRDTMPWPAARVQDGGAEIVVTAVINTTIAYVD